MESLPFQSCTCLERCVLLNSEWPIPNATGYRIALRLTLIIGPMRSLVPWTTMDFQIVRLEQRAKVCKAAFLYTLAWK